MARFDRLWGKFFRGHPFVKDDKDVTAADFAKYHVVLFGDPGSNKWIAKTIGKLPVKWTKQSVTLGAQTFPSRESFPALIYPNPLNPAKYVVLNTGLTIEDRGYNGDYGTPLWGDYAIVKVTGCRRSGSAHRRPVRRELAVAEIAESFSSLFGWG